MNLIVSRIAAIVTVLYLAPLNAQQPDKSATGVSRLLVRLNGSFPANGLPVGPIEGATLSIYREEQGGVPLWQETQNVRLDASGQYTAMLDITPTGGLPVNLFSATERRWLGVQFNRAGEVEQRVQLLIVPYELKALDVETLGDKPAPVYPVSRTPWMTDTESDVGTTTPGSAADINCSGSIRSQGNAVFQRHSSLSPPVGNGVIQGGSLKQPPISPRIPLTARLR